MDNKKKLNLFIKRPKFAIVISLTIVLAGLIMMNSLPLEQYPSITPPQIEVVATYTGASSDVIRDTIAAPIETQLNGVEDMIYMDSSSQNGSYTLDLFFKVGSDSDMALINTNNRLQLVTPRLPEEVRRYGLAVKKRTGGPGLLLIAVNSPNNTYDPLYIANYASIYIKDEIARIKGVGNVSVFGSTEYSMRIWLDTNKLANLGVSATEVLSAIRTQNSQAAIGNIGVEPLPKKHDLKITLRTKGRLKSVEEFENIIVRSSVSGQQVKLKDISRVELGAESYSFNSYIGGKKSAMITVSQLPEANSIDLANKIKAKMKELEKGFPQGLEYKIQRDETEFVNESIQEVEKAIALAILLVAIVTYFFLGTARAAFIPLCAIPVSLVGVFIFLGLLGFSINLLMLFGMVLAVGLVVDDAIVVLENAQRHIQNEMSPKEATQQTMIEVTGAVVATSLVLMAVFVPVCFMPGINGRMFQQFAVCIACSMGISTLVALSLTPALCSTILKNANEEKEIEIIKKFDVWFNKVRDKYLTSAKYFVDSPKITLYTLLGLILAIIILFKIIPTGFLPAEDQGAVFTQIQLPDGSSASRTMDVSKIVEERLKAIDGVDETINLVGFESENTAFIVSDFKPWDKRKKASLSMESILEKIRKEFANFPDAMIVTFPPSPIPGLGDFGGFEFQLLDKGDRSPQELASEAMKLIRAANADPQLTSVFTSYTANLPQLMFIVDEKQALAQNVSIEEIYITMGAIFGTTYVNDFNKYGRVYRVMVQADGNFREQISDISKVFVKNKNGQMVPIKTMVKIQEVVGPYSLTRFNMYNAVTITGSAKGQASSGQAMKAMEKLANSILPKDMGFAWSSNSLQEKESSGQIGVILTLALVFVYLFLVALYESWTLPIAVMLISPVSIIGALFAQYISGYTLDLYCQIGLIMLVGLSTKQAILIIEFAKEAYEKNGGDAVAAAMEAAKLRFRAVMMTNIAFILGVSPLVVASGAGAASRHSVGTTVFGGMLAVAFVGTMLVPGFFVIVQKMKEITHNKLSKFGKK